MSVFFKVSSLSSVAFALAAAACNADVPPPTPQAPVGISAPQPPHTTAAPVQQGQDPAVNLSSDIMNQCKIQVSSAPPKFDFDSSNLSSQERDILAQVAKCLTTGPLAGRSLKLTGRADPRGEQEYNMNLGEHRATSVRKYLVGLGLADGRMSETSRGALDATGKDEAGWQNDRRVDLSLQ
jgi:peptidoglycan-associated lipoprotein